MKKTKEPQGNADTQAKVTEVSFGEAAGKETENDQGKKESKSVEP